MDKQETPPVKKIEKPLNPKLQKQESQSKDGNPLQNKKRYKRCCIKCKHTQKGRRSCVCVVPLGQRRTEIGDNGCQTCGCNGCSIEDYVSRGQDPEYKPEYNSNGCCKQCMKAFSKTNKSCLCQVPKEVRKSELPVSGCKVCHCTGCHPEDKRQYSSESDYDRRRSSKPINKRYDRDKGRQRDRGRQRERERDRGRSYSSSGSEFSDIGDNLNNADRSSIGAVIAEAGLYAPLLGLGIPQRSYSYIIGRPMPK